MSTWDIEDTAELGPVTPLVSTVGPAWTLIFFYVPIGLFFAIWVWFVDANVIGRIIVVLLSLYLVISAIFFLHTTVVISVVKADDSLVVDVRRFFQSIHLSRYPDDALSVYKSYAHCALMAPDRRLNLVHTSFLLSAWLRSRLASIGLPDFDPRVHPTPAGFDPDFRMGRFQKFRCSECETMFEVDVDTLPATVNCPSCDRAIDLPALGPT